MLLTSGPQLTTTQGAGSMRQGKKGGSSRPRALGRGEGRGRKGARVFWAARWPTAKRRREGKAGPQGRKGKEKWAFCHKEGFCLFIFFLFSFLLFQSHFPIHFKITLKYF